MAYKTGQAADATDLVNILKTEAAANGFTVSGDMVSSSYSFTRVKALNVNDIEVLGFGASNGTTDPGPAARLARLPAGNWPATYYLFTFTNPAELFCIVKYGAERHTWLGFGELQKAYNYTGGSYYSAMYRPSATLERFYMAFNTAPSSLSGTNQLTFGGGGPQALAGCFLWGGYGDIANTFVTYNTTTGFLRCRYNGAAWPDATLNPCASELSSLLLQAQPNRWNSQSVLLPIRATIWAKASNAYVDFGAVPYARYMRVDNYLSGDILTLGTDRWMTFPFHRKDTADRNSTAATTDGWTRDHTGTYGWAIKYDGP